MTRPHRLEEGSDMLNAPGNFGRKTFLDIEVDHSVVNAVLPQPTTRESFSFFCFFVWNYCLNSAIREKEVFTKTFLPYAARCWFRLIFFLE